jgi:hypothetical protein
MGKFFSMQVQRVAKLLAGAFTFMRRDAGNQLLTNSDVVNLYIQGGQWRDAALRICACGQSGRSLSRRKKLEELLGGAFLS